MQLAARLNPVLLESGVYTMQVIRVFEGNRPIKNSIPVYKMPLLGITFAFELASITHKFDLIDINGESADVWLKLGKLGYCCGVKTGESFMPSQLLGKYCRITIKESKIIKITKL